MTELPDELKALLRTSDPSVQKGPSKPPGVTSPPAAHEPPDPPGPPYSAEIEALWSAFLERYSRLILAICQRNCHWDDGAIDGYAYALERIREKNFARLRKYSPCPGCKFETWLTGVAKRLCIDLYRIKFRPSRARPGGDDDARVNEKEEELKIQRILLNWLFDSLDVIAPPPIEGESAEDKIARKEVRAALMLCFAALVARDRLLIKLRFVDGATAAEVAALMHFATQWHVFRAEKAVLNSLRDCLASKGISGR